MNLLNKIGFYKTLRILDDIDGKISLKNFYARLNEESYYNAFFRVKNPLLKAKLIRISRRTPNKKRTIEITERGKRVWALIGMIYDLTRGA